MRTKFDRFFKKNMKILILFIIFVTLVSAYVIHTNTVSTTSSKQSSSHQTKYIPPKYRDTLNKANYYANTLNLSKKRINNILSSKFGDHLPADQVNYAINNVKANWYKNALIKANSLIKDISKSNTNLSDNELKHDLTSIAMFTEKESDYAIKHVNRR